jgi:hypothetical protein
MTTKDIHVVKFDREYGMKIENVFSSRQMYRHITRKKNPIKFNYMYVLRGHSLESLEEAKHLNITKTPYSIIHSLYVLFVKHLSIQEFTLPPIS